MDVTKNDKQQSIAIMNMNLQDIQQDIHRLATQQSQMQAQHLQAQQLMQAQQIANMLNQVSIRISSSHRASHQNYKINSIIAFIGYIQNRFRLLFVCIRLFCYLYPCSIARSSD